MKKNLLFLLLFISSSIFGQSNFSNGFSDGYKKGFCQNQGVGCISPIAPIAPIPNIGENLNSYQDGYNRGFESGLNAQKTSNNSSSSTRTRYQTAKPNFIDFTSNLNSNGNSLMDLKIKAISAIIERAENNLEIENYNGAIENANSLLEIQPNLGIAYVIKSNAQYKKDEILNAYNNSAKAYSILSNGTAKEWYDFMFKEMSEYLANFMKISNFSNIQYNCENFWYKNNLSNYYLGLSYYYQQDYKKAKKYFNKVDDFEPAKTYLKSIENKTVIENPFIKKQVVKTESNKQNSPINNEVKKVNSSNENPNEIFTRALSKSNSNDNIGALMEYIKLIEIGVNEQGTNYDLATVYNNTAYALTNLKRYNDALPYVNKALELNKNYWYIWDTKGEIEFNLGNYNQCIEDMSKAITIKKDQNSLYFRGLSYMKIMKFDLGCKDLSSSEELGKKEANTEIKKYCK